MHNIRCRWGSTGTKLREGMLSCDIVHPDQPRQCFRHFGTFFVAAVRRAMPVYVTLYGVFAISSAIRHALARRSKRLSTTDSSSSSSSSTPSTKNQESDVSHVLLSLYLD